jgi:hypothetical protein
MQSATSRDTAHRSSPFPFFSEAACLPYQATNYMATNELHRLAKRSNTPPQTSYITSSI